MIPSYSIHLNMRLPSVANLREHWAAKAKRAKSQRFAGRVAGAGARLVVPGPWIVTLTRLAARPLDDDNLASAFKSFRDGVADGLGLKDDRSPDVQWRYAQARAERGEAAAVGVRVEYAGE